MRYYKIDVRSKYNSLAAQQLLLDYGFNFADGRRNPNINTALSLLVINDTNKSITVYNADFVGVVNGTTVTLPRLETLVKSLSMDLILLGGTNVKLVKTNGTINAGNIKQKVYVTHPNGLNVSVSVLENAFAAIEGVTENAHLSMNGVVIKAGDINPIMIKMESFLDNNIEVIEEDAPVENRRPLPREREEQAAGHWRS